MFYLHVYFLNYINDTKGALLVVIKKTHPIQWNIDIFFLKFMPIEALLNNIYA